MVSGLERVKLFGSGSVRSRSWIVWSTVGLSNHRRVAFGFARAKNRFPRVDRVPTAADVARPSALRTAFEGLPPVIAQFFPLR